MDEPQSSSIPSCAPAAGVSQDEYDQVRNQVASLSAAYEEQQRVNERQQLMFQKQRQYEKQQRQLQELYFKMGLDPQPSSPAEENDDEDEDEDDDEGGADGGDGSGQY